MDLEQKIAAKRKEIARASENGTYTPKLTEEVEALIKQRGKDTTKGGLPRGYCIVCEHPKREAIEAALDSGVSLRVIEAKCGISRTTLSRHNSHRNNIKGIEVLNDILPAPKLSLKSQDYSIESVADIIAGLSELVKKLRIERDAFEEQVGLLEISLKEKILTIEDLEKRGKRLAVSITEAQQLLAQENRRY